MLPKKRHDHEDSYDFNRIQKMQSYLSYFYWKAILTGLQIIPIVVTQTIHLYCYNIIIHLANVKSDFTFLVEPHGMENAGS